MKAGWLEVSMSLDIETNRVHDPASNADDILAITVRLTNGANGLIT
jgi:hypothetical protein